MELPGQDLDGGVHVQEELLGGDLSCRVVRDHGPALLLAQHRVRGDAEPHLAVAGERRRREEQPVARVQPVERPAHRHVVVAAGDGVPREVPEDRPVLPVLRPRRRPLRGERLEALPHARPQPRVHGGHRRHLHPLEGLGEVRRRSGRPHDRDALHAEPAPPEVVAQRRAGPPARVPAAEHVVLLREERNDGSARPGPPDHLVQRLQERHHPHPAPQRQPEHHRHRGVLAAFPPRPRCGGGRPRHRRLPAVQALRGVGVLRAVAPSLQQVHHHHPGCPPPVGHSLAEGG